MILKYLTKKILLLKQAKRTPSSYWVPSLQQKSIMIALVVCVLVLATHEALALCSSAVSKTYRSTGAARLQAFKENEREEQMRIQAEMLARRKNKPKMKEYFEKVEEKREKTYKEYSKNIWAKSSNDVDPLDKWKKARDAGEIKKIGYDSEPPRSSSLFGISIPLPVNPIGIARYDEGERFDLRLPYAERGYEDPDADVLANLGKSFRNLFGGKKKDDAVETKQDPKKKK